MSLVPMRFEWVEVDALPRFVADENWVIEQKFDGQRLLCVKWPHGKVSTLANGGGTVASSAALLRLPPIVEWMEALPDDGMWALDGELVIQTGVWVVFDLLWFADRDVQGEPFESRRRLLEQVMEKLASDRVRIAPQAKTAEQKARLVRMVEDNVAEGVMVKRKDAPYQQGVRVKTALKVKYEKTADCVVTARPEDREAAVLACYDEGGNLVEVGGCSMIGRPDARPGDVIEVRYLYWTGSSLYQPRMTRIRYDKEPEDCRTDQFVPMSRDVVEVA